MQLQISRDVQAQKGLMGGDKGAIFTLSPKIEVTPDDAALIDRFKLDGFAITKQNVNGVEIDGHTVGALREGGSSQYDSLLGLMEPEQILVSSFEQLVDLLDFGSRLDEEPSFGAADGLRTTV